MRMRVHGPTRRSILVIPLPLSTSAAQAYSCLKAELIFMAYFEHRDICLIKIAEKLNPRR